ncbi:uncharacterized protein LOC124814890 [Hydra vulgaris]|uniref:uncharacterized protein LOC124814890 n=1 Tax=Hydra vulgaris TaxID=6087 RepID=UPI001F5E66B7|nr:uncharacterized protein LOC124814890 [Hydra vulgaris]
MAESSNSDELVIGVLSLQDFKLWNTVALTAFLSLRKKSINGSFDTLAARAFAAYEEGAEVDPEKEHIEKSILHEYKQKLQIENEVLPDPIDLKTGWFNEKDGVELWPHLYFSDISRFYAKSSWEKI